MRKRWTRDRLIAEAKNAYAVEQTSLSRSKFEQVTGISQHHVYRLFEGGWAELKQCAGIPDHPKFHRKLSDEELLKEFHSVTEDRGDVPTWSVFAARSKVSSDVVRRRFGGKKGTLEAYRSWLEQNHPDSPLLPQIRAQSRVGVPSKQDLQEDDGPGVQFTPTHQISGGRYGAPISFRGLHHAPINEHGVVFLFGMVSRDLGFLVESIQSTFPDCEAKRRINDRRGIWSRVRIEFEFQSRNFKTHGHDVEACDLIVCWEDNWPECPVEVLELRTVLEELDGSV